MSRKLVSFDWAIKKSCDRRILIELIKVLSIGYI